MLINKLDEMHRLVTNELVHEIEINKQKRLYLHMATGSGKTNVATHFIFKNHIFKNKRVLILSHNWFLLEQFMLRMKSLYPKFNYSDCCGFWGGESNVRTKGFKLAGISSFRDRHLDMDELQILFSTYQSMGPTVLGDKREFNFKELSAFKPDLIIIDEAHWGKSGENESAIFQYIETYFPKAILVGLTATPKVRRNWKKVGNIYYSDLVEQGLLAKADVKNIKTESNVELRFDSTHMLINESELYRDKKRNSFIVERTIKEREKSGKTLVFAGDTEHADTLCKMLSARGLSVITVHSQDYDPSGNLKSFRNGSYDIAVTVHMLSEGIDIPDITTVVIARAVQSEIIYAQMVGRGSRITESKSSFTLVDFHDSTEKEENQKHLFHYKDYYNLGISESRGRSAPVFARPKQRLRAHQSNFQSRIETLVYDPKHDPSYYSALHGLKIDAEQTFGIEFELFCKGVDIENSKEWTQKAIILNQVLIDVFGKENVGPKPVHDHTRVKSIDYSLWNVVYDGSCGFEIVSPILKGREGFEEVTQFLRYLRISNVLIDEGFEVNYQTGTHIHLGWKYKDPQKVQDILRLVYKYEGAFNSLISPSRIVDSSGSPNSYCTPVRSEFTLSEIESIDTISALKKFFGDHEDRYKSVNLTKFNMPDSTIEIRSHNGTLSEKKILTWVALWMNCINSIERLKKGDLKDLKSTTELFPGTKPQDDILNMCESLFDFNSVNGAMLSSLQDRRMELLRSEGWKKIHQNEKTEQLINTWSKSFDSNHIIQNSKPWNNSNKFHEDLFVFTSLPESLRNRVAENLIKTNDLKISHSKLIESLSENFLLVSLKKDEIISTLGIKQTSDKFLSAIMTASKLKTNILDKDINFDLLTKKFKEGLAIEKGWAYNSGAKLAFKKMNTILEDYFQILYPTVKGHFLFSTVDETNEAGIKYLKNGKMKPILRIKSPFSENNLILHIKNF